MRFSTFILLMCLLGAVSAVEAQTVTRDSATIKIKSKQMPRASSFNTWDLGARFGLTVPNTDIAASDLNAKNMSSEIAYGLNLTKFLTHSFAFQADFLKGKLSGDGASQGSNRVYNFKTDIKYQLMLNALFQIGNISFLKRNPNFAIYGYLGAGFIKFNPTVTKDGFAGENNYFVQDNKIDTTVNYHNTTEAIYAFGLGFKYRIAKPFSLSIQYSLNKINSDKLDGWNRLLSENDNYSFFNLGLTYHIGQEKNMIEWHNPMYNIFADLYDVKDKVDLMTRDTDNDGVADIFDREPDTPPGNKVYGDGTSIDSDGDGVPDIIDTEPFSAKNSKVDASGKEIDTDGDGIPDTQDMEPGTAKGSLVSKQGITIPVAAKGKGTGGSSVLASNGWLPSIFFDLNSDEIAVKYNETLATIALIMKNNPDLSLKIVGNCDFRSSIDYNIKLGKRRADAVKKHLIKKYKIDSKRLTIETLGKNDPLTNQDHRMNRRVDFKVDE